MVDDETHFITECRITQDFRDILYKAASKKKCFVYTISSQEKIHLFTADNTTVMKETSMVCISEFFI